ncbi:MAG: ABC transporter ATP-binding protein [Planctomycetota bacterium]|jgi:lipooligosaccharide transport system ATP-binding protein
MAQTIITIRNISKSFGKVRAVRNLSFSVEAGSCFGFLGPNGAGKTTAMKIIYGKCTRNRDGESLMDIFGYDPATNELAIKYLSGVVQQENNLDDELNVIQNLMIYSRFYDMPGRTAAERIEYLLDFLELSEKADSKIKELSGGMKRRLVIARALLNSPRLLILDEPTTGLDPQVRHRSADNALHGRSVPALRPAADHAQGPEHHGGHAPRAAGSKHGKARARGAGHRAGPGDSAREDSSRRQGGPLPR